MRGRRREGGRRGRVGREARDGGVKFAVLCQYTHTMSTSILPFVASAEALGHAALDVSNFANAEYAASSLQSFDYQSVAPQTTSGRGGGSRADCR